MQTNTAQSTEAGQTTMQTAGCSYFVVSFNEGVLHNGLCSPAHLHDSATATLDVLLAAPLCLMQETQCNGGW